MIVLPNVPPIPTVMQCNPDGLTPQLLSNRAALSSSSIETYNDLVRYVINLEEYVDDLFQFASTKVDAKDIGEVLNFTMESELLNADYPPWTNILYKNDKKLKYSGSGKGGWTLFNEIELSIVATSFIYIRLGAELVNELIELDSDLLSMEEINEKWKQVVAFYKKSISYIQFGMNINAQYSGPNHLNASLFMLIDKISNINIQMSTLSKFSWMNRNSYNENETFTSNNNGTLCRVAIFVLDELKNCKSLVSDIQDNSHYKIYLNSNDWLDYLKLIEKYANAYAGLFLSIDTYQQNKLGNSIGLINFALLNLQSKKIGDFNHLTKLAKLTSKFASKKNESYIKNLQSITSLNLNSSLFNEKSGIVLKDITYLFDQLIQLHLKFTKENDNLKFDTVANYQDIHKDNKWPIGSKIPVSNIPDYIPRVFNLEPHPTARSAYY